MTIGEALQDFFSGFSLPAYPSTAVPDDAVMPYLTYTVSVSSFQSSDSLLTVNLWYRNESEAIPNAKAEEIRKEIEQGGVLPLDRGFIWLKPGSPFWYTSPDEDNSIKRRILNIAAEYFC